MPRVLKPGGVALYLLQGGHPLLRTAARTLPFGELVRLLH